MSSSKRHNRSDSKSMDAGDRKIVGGAKNNNRKHLHRDEDVMFFSSTSISSTDSSSLGFSSSDTESISRASCFAPQVGRGGGGSASFRSEKQGMRIFDSFCRTSSHRSSEHAHSQFCITSRRHLSVSEDHKQIRHGHRQVTACDEEEEALMIKSKSRALKIYNNLKKVKQPISPGGRVTSFLNSLFANTKKTTTTTTSTSSRTCGEVNTPSSSSSCYYSSTCSSASSFSRSCLSKTMSSERDRLRNGVKRTVRFYPVSVIVDEDSRPCGDKRLCEEEEASGEFLREYNRHNSKIKSNDNLVLKDLPLRKTNLVNDGDHNDDHEDDASSYASSDLFELDHLAVFGSGRYSEELPVYETTHVSTNRAIANGLIV